MTPLQQSIIEAFQSDVYVSGKMDVQHTPVYDTVTIAAGSSLSLTTSALFTSVGAQSNKTLAQTNMTQSQRLPAPEAFSIKSIRLYFANSILRADLVSIIGGFVFEFWLGQKAYQRAPLWYFPQGGGLWASTVLNGDYFYANGQPNYDSIRPLAIPIVIENQMQFYGQFQGNAYTLTAAGSGGLGVTYVGLLDGLYARGVQ